MGTLKFAVLPSLFALVILTGCEKPQDPAAVHRALGNEYARKAEWAAAANEYGLSLQSNPGDRKLWELKANAHLRMGQLGPAAECLVKQAEYSPDPAAKAESYRFLAGLYVEQRDFEQAEKAFMEALKFDPRDENSLSWLGELASVRGGARSMSDPADPVWLTKAVAYYDKVISINPDNLFAYVNKRIAMTKLLALEEQETAVAERLTQLERKDAARLAAAQTRLTESAARREELKKDIESLSTKIKELLAIQKAKKQGAS